MREEKVRDQALRALRGAERFAEQFESALKMGPESVYRVAYAVKTRVKSEDSLVEKVLDRCKTRPDYNAYKVTDIVGVRFICIHSRDLIELCRLFVRSIPFLQSPSVQLLQGDTIDAAIQEVIVFRTGASSDDYGDCVNFFRSLEPELNSGKVSEKRLDRQDRRQYSSVHIVCRGRSYHDGINLRMPLEVQIRTAFEDVWGAIQYDVEYKKKFITNTDRKLEERYDNAVRQLNALKMALEGATIQADGIKSEIDQIRKLTEPTAPASVRAIRRRLDSTGRNRFPVEVREAAAALDAEIDKLFQIVAEEYKKPRGAVKSINALNQGLNLIDEFLKLYINVDHRRYEGDSEGRFHISMDRALIHFWMSRVLVRDGREDEAQAYIARSIRIYKTLQATAEYRKDALLEYRLGHALISSGAIPDAVVLLEAAVEHLQTDQRLDKKDLFRALIPRQLGYALWRLAQIHSDGLRAELLERAVHATLKSFSVFLEADIRDREELSEALMYAANNVVSYLGAIYLFHGHKAAISIFTGCRDLITNWVACTKLREHASPPVLQTIILLDLLEEQISLKEMRERSLKLLEDVEQMGDDEKHELGELREYIGGLIRAIEHNEESDEDRIA